MRTLTCLVVLGGLVFTADPPRKDSEDGRDISQPVADPAGSPPDETRAVLAPADAVKVGAKKVVTVEFSVGSANFLLDNQRAYGTGPVPTVVLQWDGTLADGGNVFVLVNGTAVSWHVQKARGKARGGARADDVPPYPSVRDLEEFCKRIKGRGVRATGRLQAIGPPWSMNYQLVLDDPDNLKMNP
jgi:hypothetical protein